MSLLSYTLRALSPTRPAGLLSALPFKLITYAFVTYPDSFANKIMISRLVYSDS